MSAASPCRYSRGLPLPPRRSWIFLPRMVRVLVCRAMNTSRKQTVLSRRVRVRECEVPYQLCWPSPRPSPAPREREKRRLSVDIGLPGLHPGQRAELGLGVLPHVGEHLGGEELHVFAREVIGQAAELWQGEDVADLELQHILEQLLAHGLRAADEDRAAGFDVVPVAGMT